MITKDEAKKINILDVATSLGMNMIKTTRNEYYWQEHDSLKIDINKNMFKWYSKDIGGDVIQLVRTIQNVSYKEALYYLEHGKFEKIEKRETTKKPFRYLLEKYEKDFNNCRRYLKEVRGISDSTIDFFLENNVIKAANRKHEDGYIEEAIVFKYFDEEKNIIGGSLHGIIPNKERYKGKGYLKQIIYNSDGTAGFNIEIGEDIKQLIFFEAPIDTMSYYELNKDKLNNVRLIAMEGLKESTIARYVVEYAIKNIENKKKLDFNRSIEYLKYIITNTDFFEKENNKNLITIAVDNDLAGNNFIKKLKNHLEYFNVELPPMIEGREKTDWNDILVNNKKDLERIQGKSVEGTIGDFLVSKKQGAVPLLDEKKSQPLNELSPNQTQPQLHLYFSIKNSKMSTIKRNYHAISDKELRKLNRYSGQLQEVANWYLNELAGYDIHYIYKDDRGLSTIKARFDKENFMHLTGIFPIKNEQTAEQTLIDFANGNGEYDNILVANRGATFSKLQVLPELESILDTSSFYFNDLSSVEKFNRLDLTTAIKTEDEDLLLLFREQDDIIVPASIMKLKGNLVDEVAGLRDKVILGIYRENNGQLEQISINKEYIKDNGKELISILESNKIQGENLMMEKENINFNENDYWIIEFNEDEPNIGLKSYEGEIVTAKLLDEIKTFDIPNVYNGYYKFYFDHYINGEVKEHIRVDIGDGVKYNKEFYDYIQEELTKDIGRETEVKDTEIENPKIKESDRLKELSDIIKKNDIKALNKFLKDGMRGYSNSDTYKNFLNVISKFRNYSPRNIMLIHLQNPYATYIASYNSWKKNFNRQVKKGQKAITIIAPIEYAKKDREGNVVLDEEGKPEISISFRRVPVFDVSQTEGKDLPRAIYNIEKEVDGYLNIYTAVKEYARSKGIKISFAEFQDDRRGSYSPEKNEIYLTKGNSKGQTIKTLFHELSHAVLHRNSEATNDIEVYRKNELEAESIAYIISNHYGLDTSEYTFGYLHSWISDKKNFSDMDKLIINIHKQSKELIEKIDNNLEKIKNQGLKKDELDNKIERLKEKQKDMIKLQGTQVEKKFRVKEPLK